MPAHHLPRLALTLLLAGSTALAACSRDEPGPPPGSSTTSAATTPPATTPATTAPPATEPPTTPPVSDEAAIEALLDRYWTAWLIANDPPNPADPELNALITGEAQTRVIENIENRKSLGQVVRLPSPSVFSHKTLSIEVNDDTAKVRECVVDDSQLLLGSSNSILNNRVTTDLFESVLTRSPDGWRIAESSTLTEVEGAVPCDAL